MLPTCDVSFNSVSSSVDARLTESNYYANPQSIVNKPTIGCTTASDSARFVGTGITGRQLNGSARRRLARLRHNSYRANRTHR